MQGTIKKQTTKTFLTIFRVKDYITYKIQLFFLQYLSSRENEKKNQNYQNNTDNNKILHESLNDHK